MQKTHPNRRLDENRIKEMQRKASNGHGPGSRYAGLKEKPKDAKKTIGQIFKYVSNNKKLLVSFVIIALLNTVIGLSVNVFMQKFIGSFGEYDYNLNVWIKDASKSDFNLYLTILIIVFIAQCLLQYVLQLLSAHLSVSTQKRLRSDLFGVIVKLPIKYTDTNKHGDIMSKMTNDVDHITQAISSSIINLAAGIITILGCIGIMLYYSPLLLLVTLVSLFLSALFTALMSKFMRPLFLRQQSILGMLNSQTEEMVTGCKTVIAYNHQETAINEFNYYSDDLCKTAIKANIWGGSMGPIMNFIGNLGYFLVCLAGALFIAKGIGNGLFGLTLDVSIVITFLNLNKQFTRPINEIAQLYSSLLTALAAGERVFALMEEPTEDFSGKVEFDVANTNGYIDFSHVAFSYVKDKPVLKDFTVDVRSGHKIALVGATGSGKTTIVNLLLRFYDIDSGTISIDGIDIKDISKKDLRDTISIVLQDAVLFGDTVENNVKYGRENATDEEFRNAIKLANCESFINRLPEKEKTVLNEGATNISQGQRQLLTIARAIIADPKILILDEATSSVDTRTEKKIQDALVNLMKNRTSIIIAHRLSTIQDADLIVVLDQGQVVEMGNHKELVELDGVYNRLYQTQFKGLAI